jgi:hypothetical protein
MPIGKGARCELTKAIMQPVNRLYRRRWVQEGPVRQRPFGNVNEQSQTIGHVLIKGALKAELDGVYRGGRVESRGRASNLEEGGAGRHELAQCWPEREDTIARLGNPS